MLCQECTKKSQCTKLCPDAEAYVNQDYVRQKEIPLSELLPSPWPVQSSNVYLTSKERQILTLLGKGLPREDVCQLMDISRHTLRMHLYNIKLKT